MDVIRKLELEHMKSELPEFSIGDTVRVSYRIREGQKSRIQVFQGTVIAMKGGGIRKTMTPANAANAANRTKGPAPENASHNAPAPKARTDTSTQLRLPRPCSDSAVPAVSICVS